MNLYDLNVSEAFAIILGGGTVESSYGYCLRLCPKTSEKKLLIKFPGHQWHEQQISANRLITLDYRQVSGKEEIE